MQEIGIRLAEARKRLGLTLEEAERSTRIRAHHLAALERGEFNGLPSHVQAKGFLRNYAEFLGLRSQELLEQYEQALSGRGKVWARRKPLHELPTRPSVQVRSRRPSWLSADLFVAAAITVAVLGLIAWGVGRVVAGMQQRTLAASEFLIPTFTPSPEAALAEAPSGLDSAAAATQAPALAVAAPPSQTPTLALSFAASSSAPVDLRLLIERRSWVRVVVDGVESYQGRANPGEILEFQGQQVVEVITGNGIGVRAFYHGQDQGPLGDLNQVVIRLWTPQGAITPTPTFTPTPGPASATPTSTAAP
jgi:transcriptional regulator with XRE-family HTH domain